MLLENSSTQTLAGTQAQVLHSKYVGDDFKIFIAHPVAPPPEGHKAPVVFVLDANLAFGLATDIARMLAFGAQMPSAYVVGIGYSVDNFTDTQLLRARDLTPTSFAQFDEHFPKTTGLPGGVRSGGAAAFLDFIHRELKPWVAQQLPQADLDDCTMVGHSLGGLFALYALLHQPDAFQRYVASSPSLWFHNEVLLQHEAAYAAAHRDLKARAFLACGALETEAELRRLLAAAPSHVSEAYKQMGRLRMVELVEPFGQTLHARNYPGLRLNSQVFPDEDHISVIPAALCRGLREVFKP